MSDIAALNRKTWSAPRAIAQFQRRYGFLDAGERVSLLAVAPHVRGKRVLDIGVGAGRTVPLLGLLTGDYVAVDYVPEMVEACRRAHPGSDIRLGDVRNLAFDDRSFALVFFSFAGIDALSHDDRPRALGEMFRVLEPGGWAVFSTHNVQGPSFRHLPWRGYPRPGSRPYRVARWVARFPFEGPRYVRRWRNWLRNRRMNRVGYGWAERAAAPHDFGLVIHYTTLGSVVDEVRNAGFTAMTVLDGATGESIDTNAFANAANVFYIVAQRPNG